MIKIFFEDLKYFFKTSERALKTLMASIFIIGVLIAILEIIFSFCLINFLYDFNLIVSDEKKNIPFLGKNPSLELILCSILLYSVKYLNLFLPTVLFQSSVCSLRERLVKKSFLGFKENNFFTLSKCTHLIANVIQKASSFKLSLVRFITYIVTSLTFFTSLIILSKELTVVLILFLIGVFLIFYAIKNKSKIHVDKVYESNTKFTKNFSKNFKNLTFLKISGISDYVTKILFKDNNELLQNSIRFQSLFSVNAIAPNILGFLFIVLLVILNKNYSLVEIGTLVPFIYLLTRVAAQLSEITQSYASLFHTYPEFREFKESYNFLYSRESNKIIEDLGTKNLKKKFKLELRKIVFGRKKSLCHKISFSLTEGKVLIIKGDTGSGKSTLISTILGLIPSKSGEIFIMDKKVDVKNIRKYKKLFFYAGTDPFLTNGSIMENLIFGINNPNPAKVKLATETCDFGFVENLKLKFNTKLGDDGLGVSSGQKQKISLARALIRSPKLLVLDEATSNMDFRTELKIFKNITKNYPDISMIIVSHRDTLDKFADRIIKLK